MVHFVGAGPGAVDLITIRAKNLIENADVVIYAGSLINKELLSLCKDGAGLYDSSHLSLNEIIMLMEEALKKERSVVRLQTGDLSLYGAIREQIDELKKRGIPYDITPGVSSFLGAAARLKAEYTVPGSSQSLIITRLEGRTPVPENERISKLSSHGTSMAVFLSAGNIGGLVEELLKGGAYTCDTKAAIVYKATWPEEKVIRCTIGTLEEAGRKNSISNTALILVGDFLDSEKEVSRSKLYDREFTTGFRRGVREGTGIICFTDRGQELSGRISDGLFERYKGSIHIYRADSDGKLREWLKDVFYRFENIVFVGACGIAVRMIAPLLIGKTVDPAVVVIDEKGENVISLLSGHIGGANRLAEETADITGARAVITTATDLNDKFAIDSFAKKYDMEIPDPKLIKTVSSAVLREEPVHIYMSAGSDDSMLSEISRQSGLIIHDTGSIPTDISVIAQDTNNVIISIYDMGIPGLILCPRKGYLGIGSKKGVLAETVKAVFGDFIKDNKLFKESIVMAGSIDLKKEEAGIRDFCRDEGFEFETFSAEELNTLNGDFTSSELVKEVTGTDSVCERSALYLALKYAKEGHIEIKKYARDGVTFALALADAKRLN
ncbi:MAG: precorrin-4 C(11)-methyltransferase [Lachnospiraceae bacterium]|nr:precorrin-4 C(11)-methyltransferase [Lachnospiraceae bacterium]